MARSERWPRTALGLGEGQQRAAHPAGGAADSNDHILKVLGCCGAAPCMRKPSWRNQLSHLASPAAASFTQQIEPIAKGPARQRSRPRRSSGSARHRRQPPAAPALRPSFPFQLSRAAQALEAPLLHKGECGGERSPPPDQGCATTIGDPSSARVVSTSPEVAARHRISTPVVGSIEAATAGVCPDQGASRGPASASMPTESWLARRSAKGSRPRRLRRERAPLPPGSVGTSRRPAN